MMRIRPIFGNDFIYAPYINLVDGSINTMFIEDAVNEEFYTIPQANGQPYITEPYKYEIDGKNIPMVSVSVPITIENNFIGVVIADFSINFLNEIIQGNLPDTAIQRIISTQGTIISDSASEANISTSITQFTSDWDSIKATVQNGEIWSFYAFAKTFDAEAYSIFLPIELGDNAQKWIIQTFIPKSTLLGTFYTFLKMTLTAGVVNPIILAASTYFFIYRNIKPLKDVQEALEKAAIGELTVTVAEKRLSNDEIGAVGMAYNTMRNEMHSIVLEVSTTSVQVDEQADTMNHVIEEMSQSSDEIAKGALSQAEEIEQSNVEMLQLGEQIDDVSLLSSDMLLQIKQSGEQAATGMQEVIILRKQSENTNEVNNQLEQQMKNLSQKIANIDQVMHSIQGITAQTNLLALNASIEAARAGEHGKGFAVVAEEVRKLAEQSHKETESVQHTVTSILQEAAQTALIVQNNSMLLTLQNDAVATTEEAFSEQLTRAEIIQQQLVGLMEKLTALVEQKEAVMTGIQTVAAISEQSAASAEEVTASADEQQNEMQTIVTMMNKLKDVARQLNAATTPFKL